MVKKQKTAGLLSGVILLSVGLSACGGGGEATEKPGAAGASNAPATTAAKESAAPQAPVKIEFWANKFEESTDAWFKKWTDEFNKTHPNIQVKLTVVPGDAWEQKLKAAQAAGNAPQVVTMNYGGIAPAAAQGKILAMDEYVDKKIWADLHANVEKFVNVKGKHYAYPKLVEPSAVLYYRKDFFQEAGLDPAKPPKTWAELIDYGKKLTKKDRYGLKIAGDAAEFAWTTWGSQMNVAGHLPISDDWSKATVMDDGFKQLVAFYKTLYSEKIVPKQPLAPYADGADFGQGKEAMAITGSWVMGQLRNDYKDILDKVGVAVVPTLDGNQSKPTASLGGWSLAIDGKAKNPKEAGEFISWLLAGDPKIMIDFFKTSKFSKFSARKSVDDALKSDPDAQNDPWRKLVAEQIVPNAISEPVYPWEVSFAFGSAIDRAVKGQDPEASLKAAEKEINDLITNKKLAGTNPLQ
jgi:multiple sugar transport system substrate-binding protein